MKVVGSHGTVGGFNKRCDWSILAAHEPPLEPPKTHGRMQLLSPKHMCQGLNSHYFHIVGDKLINPIVGVYIPIIRIPIKGGMTIPNIATFDHGTYRGYNL